MLNWNQLDSKICMPETDISSLFWINQNAPSFKKGPAVPIFSGEASSSSMRKKNLWNLKWFILAFLQLTRRFFQANSASLSGKQDCCITLSEPCATSFLRHFWTTEQELDFKYLQRWTYFSELQVGIFFSSSACWQGSVPRTSPSEAVINKSSWERKLCPSKTRFILGRNMRQVDRMDDGMDAASLKMRKIGITLAL